METLVHLHGGGVTPQDYQDLIESLKQKYRVIAPNLYDLAETKKFTWKKMAENLDKLLNNEEKVYLVGTSLGADLALAYAAFYPQKVKAVIACEPVGRMKRSIIGWTYALQKATIRALFYPGGLRKIMKPRFNFLKEAPKFRRIYSLTKMVRKEDYEDSLKKIKAPVYLLWSKNSGLLPLWVGERLHQRIPDSTLNPNFSNKNHLWCFLEQKKLAREIKKILETSPLGERG
jgi:2-hydroxy-6-oxonona-2,4-dienedioate hydrolase